MRHGWVALLSLFLRLSRRISRLPSLPSTCQDWSAPDSGGKRCMSNWLASGWKTGFPRRRFWEFLAPNWGPVSRLSNVFGLCLPVSASETSSAVAVEDMFEWEICGSNLVLMRNCAARFANSADPSRFCCSRSKYPELSRRLCAPALLPLRVRGWLRLVQLFWSAGRFSIGKVQSVLYYPYDGGDDPTLANENWDGYHI